jgi:hypothetical protein
MQLKASQFFTTLALLEAAPHIDALTALIVVILLLAMALMFFILEVITEDYA